MYLIAQKCILDQQYQAGLPDEAYRSLLRSMKYRNYVPKERVEEMLKALEK